MKLTADRPYADPEKAARFFIPSGFAIDALRYYFCPMRSFEVFRHHLGSRALMVVTAPPVAFPGDEIAITPSRLEIEGPLNASSSHTNPAP